MSRIMLMFAALSGFLFVALGAFGAHALADALGQKALAWLRTGLEYQGFHTLAILGLAVLMRQQPMGCFRWSAIFLALGIVLFSGSLYALALSPWRLWVYITPLGGACFLVGWILMFIGALRLARKADCHE